MEKILRPVIKDNKVINLKENLINIRKIDDEKLLSEYQHEIIDYIKEHNTVYGLKELEAALSVRLDKLAEYKTYNKSILKKLKQQNVSLDGLSIIEELNNKKEINYLQDKSSPELSLLELENKTSLSNFINENANLALYGSSKEIFNYLVQLGSSKIIFELVDDKKLNNEIKEINNYKKQNGITEPTKIAITKDEEKLYLIRDLIIKFKERGIKMEIINDEVKNKELEMSRKENITATTEKESTIDLMTANKLISLCFNNTDLSLEENKQLYEFIRVSINKMKETKLSYDYQNTIDIYIVYLENKRNLSGLNEKEELLLNQYRDVIINREKEMFQNETLTNEENKLKLVPTNLNTNGAVVTVVILEVTMLLGILLSVLALAFR